LKKQLCLPDLCTRAALIFRLGLPIAAFAFLYIFMLTATASQNEIAWLAPSIFPMLEYAVMTLSVVVCGGLFTDIAIKKS